VHDEQRRGLVGLDRRAVEKRLHTRDEAPASELDPLGRSSVDLSVEPVRRPVFRPLDNRLVAEGAGRDVWVRRVGTELPVDPEEVFEPVDVRPREAEPPGAVDPVERRPGPRPRDVLAQFDGRVATLRVGKRELDRVRQDARRRVQGLGGGLVRAAIFHRGAGPRRKSGQLRSRNE
jgi:hypothetical protein